MPLPRHFALLNSREHYKTRVERIRRRAVSLFIEANEKSKSRLLRNKDRAIGIRFALRKLGLGKAEVEAMERMSLDRNQNSNNQQSREAS